MSYPEIRTAIEQLSDDELDGLRRETELGTDNFSQAVEKLRVVRGLLEALDVEREEDLPTDFVPGVVGQLNDIENLKERMRAFSWGMDNAQPEKAGIDAAVEGKRSWMVSTIKPQIRGQEIEASALVSEAVDARDQVSEAAKEATALLERLRTGSGEAGAASRSAFYKGQAKDDADRARLFLGLIGAAIVGLFVVGLSLFVFYPPTTADGDEGWQEFLRELFVRLFFLGIAGYVLAFAARNYRISKHLQTANEEKENAVETYARFIEAATPEAQNIITAELVRAVFAPTPTGFLADERERTIIETQPSVLGMVRQSPQSE